MIQRALLLQSSLQGRCEPLELCCGREEEGGVKCVKYKPIDWRILLDIIQILVKRCRCSIIRWIRDGGWGGSFGFLSINEDMRKVE